MVLPRFELGTPAVSGQCSNLAELQDHVRTYWNRFIRVLIILSSLQLDS